MSKIWFCRNCGYEVTSRGRCHACKARLSTSPLPELAPGADDDEVGYRLQDWTDRNRSRLIIGLIERNILHRFEDDELVVHADDEARADALVEEIAADDAVDGVDPDVVVPEVVDPELVAEDAELRTGVASLLAAARRLELDATDMEADGDVAHASATVFVSDGLIGTDPATWAAVGRVTRRLLAALGADEALEDEIRLQAAILVKLLEPHVGSIRPAHDPAGVTATDGGPVEEPATAAGAVTVTADAAVAGALPDGGPEEEATDEPARTGGAGESVYELPEWLPEQRAELSVLLEAATIAYGWEGGDLVVAVADEDRVEALFDRVEGVSADEDDEARYRALEDLFAAADRLANDPSSEPKGSEVVRAVANVEGPTPLGLDDAQWWSIRSRARALAESIERDANVDVVFDEATTLRDLLRVLV